MNTDLEYKTILPAHCGAWDITSYPFGGDFIRPKEDIFVTNLTDFPEKLGWKKAECSYPNRKGIRTIVSNQFTTISVPIEP